MKSLGPGSLRDSEGKGIIGCMIFIVLIAVAIFLGIKLGPIYYSNYNFESDVKEEVSRAGAHVLTEETVITDLLRLAEKNGIQITPKDIKVQRFAGQVHIEVNYAVPIDFLVLQRNIAFQIKASSFAL
jgi:hypothetical protein